MKAKTFDDWKLLGFRVIKGVHSTSRDKQGKCLFTRDQVKNIEDDFTFDGHRIKSNFDDSDLREKLDEIKPDFGEDE